jgi:Rho-binding antiterminator
MSIRSQRRPPLPVPVAGPILGAMGHMLDRCDIVDMLEEAVVTGRQVAIELRSNKKFVDHVRDVVTESGQEWAVFKHHDTVPVSDIHNCARAEPMEPTYAGKIS